MAITTPNVMDFGFLTKIFDGFDFGGALLVLVLVGISAVAITRDTRHMRLLLFPLVFGWSRIGLDVPTYLLAGSAIVSVVTLVGIHNIGATLGGLQGAITERFRGTATGERRSRERAIDRAEQDFTLTQELEPLTEKKAEYQAKRSEVMDILGRPQRLRKRGRQLEEDILFNQEFEALIRKKKRQKQQIKN